MRHLSDGDRMTLARMMRDAAPDIEVIRDTMRTCRRGRRCCTGHVIKIGERYQEIVYLEDGAFKVNVMCLHCMNGVTPP